MTSEQLEPRSVLSGFVSNNVHSDHNRSSMITHDQSQRPKTYQQAFMFRRERTDHAVSEIRSPARITCRSQKLTRVSP